MCTLLLKYKISKIVWWALKNYLQCKGLIIYKIMRRKCDHSFLTAGSSAAEKSKYFHQYKWWSNTGRSHHMLGNLQSTIQDAKDFIETKTISMSDISCCRFPNTQSAPILMEIFRLNRNDKYYLQCFNYVNLLTDLWKDMWQLTAKKRYKKFYQRAM